MNFGKRLQQAIDEMEISQAELGRRVGATAQSVNGWCSAGILPRKEILEQLPKATGRPVYWFFMTDEDEELLKKGYSAIPNLSEEQRTMLALFDKLLPDDQLNMINVYRARIEELEAWAKKHFIDKKPL
ncbi:helix-turn-helix domain-containing protein [Franconibacter pulveris 1160]|uniref:helix-turn-helix domain-containing protein n=1 Tax=Franconibacter pulveris TaxID=435910 RepID=UPI0004652D1B|nr:helix-turn-helix domain-containing protein [Franconibacter pulveris]